MVLAYPNTYRVAMSNLGFQAIRQLTDDTPGWTCDRLFLPDDAQGGRAAGQPLRTFDNAAAPTDADLVAFSVSYELDFVNVVRLLRLLGVAELAAERPDDDPLVALGGVMASLNIEPIANFVDLVVVGEGEAALPGVLAAVAATRGQRKSDRLAALSALDGVYVPSLYQPVHDADGRLREIRKAPGALERVRRVIVPDLRGIDTASTVLTPNTEFADMRLVEVSRGCARGCLFCIVPTCLRPTRFRDPEHVLALGRAWHRVGLLGAAASDHPDIERIICDLADDGREVSLSASRSEPLTARGLSALARAGQRTLTLAPETGSQRLRDAIGKRMHSDDVLGTARMAAEAGFRTIKLYFMVGLPGEDDGEPEAILALTEEVCRAARGARVALSVNPFVPKPGTPLQWEPMADVADLRESIARISRGAGRLPGHPRASCEGPRWPVIEALLSRGDRRLGQVLCRVASSAGSPSDYKRALTDEALSVGEYVHRRRDPDECFPWDTLDTGASRDHLWRRRLRMEGEASIGR